MRWYINLVRWIKGIEVSFKFKKEETLTIDIPSVYRLDSSFITENVVNDIKSQVINILIKDKKFEKKLKKIGKVLVKFETSMKHYRLIPRNIWLYYSDGQLYDVYGQDRNLWEREQKLKELLGE